MINRFNSLVLGVISFGVTTVMVCTDSATFKPEQLLTIAVCGGALTFSLIALADLFLYGLIRMLEALKTK